MNMNRKYLNVKDLCKYIYRSESSVRKMVMRKEIPFRKVGSRVLFVEEEIDQWVDNGYIIKIELPVF